MPKFSTSEEDENKAQQSVNDAKVRGFFIGMAMKGK
jgi:hypothetical protein